MAYGDYNGPDKEDKGLEGGSCNRGRCQASPANYYNNGSLSWYCMDCARDIGHANRHTFSSDMGGVDYPMFETREDRDARGATHPVKRIVCDVVSNPV